MALSDKFRLCAVGLGTTILSQITESTISDQVQELLAPDGNTVYNLASSVGLQDVRVRFTTQMVKSVLSKVTLVGLNLSGNSCVLYFTQHSQGGGLAATGVSFTIAAGLAVVRSIDASDGSLATATVEVIGTSSNGTAAPWVKATGATLPTMPTAEMYMLTGTTGVRDLRIDPGIDVLAARGDNTLYNTLATIRSIQPRVTMTQHHMTDIGVITHSNNGSVSLLDTAQGAGRGSTPIVFTFNQMQGSVDQIGGSDVVQTFTMIPSYNGTNAPIVVTGV